MQCPTALLTLLICSLGAAVAGPGAAQNREQALAPVSAGPINRDSPPAIEVPAIRVEVCARLTASGRCLARPTGHIQADHGPAYDHQGNLVDGHGHVVATPHEGGAREVFVSWER